MAGVLEAEAIKVLTACSGQEALELLARNEVQVLLAGEQLQEMDGVSLLARARSLYPELVRIMLISESGFAPLVEMVNAVAVYKVLPRSWSAERLVTEIVDAFEHHEKRNLSGSTTVI
jgi:DNA-binding NtrC family response regulator